MVNTVRRLVFSSVSISSSNAPLSLSGTVWNVAVNELSTPSSRKVLCNTLPAELAVAASRGANPALAQAWDKLRDGSLVSSALSADSACEIARLAVLQNDITTLTKLAGDSRVSVSHLATSALPRELRTPGATKATPIDAVGRRTAALVALDDERFVQKALGIDPSNYEIAVLVDRIRLLPNSRGRDDVTKYVFSRLAWSSSPEVITQLVKLVIDGLDGAAGVVPMASTSQAGRVLSKVVERLKDRNLEVSAAEAQFHINASAVQQLEHRQLSEGALAVIRASATDFRPFFPSARLLVVNGAASPEEAKEFASTKGWGLGILEASSYGPHRDVFQAVLQELPNFERNVTVAHRLQRSQVFKLVTNEHLDDEQVGCVLPLLSTAAVARALFSAAPHRRDMLIAAISADATLCADVVATTDSVIVSTDEETVAVFDLLLNIPGVLRSLVSTTPFYSASAGGLRKRAAARLAGAFGTEEEAWRTAFSIIDTHHGNLDDLVRVVIKLPKR